MVEKFKFDTRLQEAVLKKRSGQQLSLMGKKGRSSVPFLLELVQGIFLVW